MCVVINFRLLHLARDVVPPLTARVSTASLPRLGHTERSVGQ